MKQLRLPIFTSKIKYYNLRIVPPSAICNEVMEFKKQFEIVFGKQPLSKSRPHITIAAFRMNSKYQEVLIRAFQELSSIEKFKLDIAGFGVFENGSNALYLKVYKTEEIEYLYREVQVLCNDNLKRKLKSLTIVDNPHVTISKTTGKKMLFESLQHFQKNNYSKRIEVGHLTLVSRSKYRTWDWEHRISLS